MARSGRWMEGGVRCGRRIRESGARARTSSHHQAAPSASLSLCAASAPSMALMSMPQRGCPPGLLGIELAKGEESCGKGRTAAERSAPTSGVGGVCTGRDADSCALAACGGGTARKTVRRMRLGGSATWAAQRPPPPRLRRTSLRLSDPRLSSPRLVPEGAEAGISACEVVATRRWRSGRALATRAVVSDERLLATRAASKAAPLSACENARRCAGTAR